MVGNKSRPKKDKAVKISGGQMVKPGEILSRGLNNYKAGMNVNGMGTLYALCAGRVVFTRKKTPFGVRTFIHVEPQVKK